jgi:malate/lactate dehydrogenase
VAVTDHVRDWHLGTGGERTTSMAIVGEGQYDTPPGVVFSFPVKVRNGKIEVVSGLQLTPFDRRMVDITGKDLLELSGTADALLS